MKRYAMLAALLLTSACASYTPAPLAGSPALLEPPVAAILEAKAGEIARPWLTQVTLDLSAPLSPNAIATLAVVNNPELKAARVRAGVSDAQVFAAGLLPDPSISLGASKVLHGPDPLLDLTSALALDINALRTHGVTREKARAEARQVRLDLAWQEWQVAGQARLEAVRIAALENQLGWAQQSAETGQELLNRTQKAAERGDVSGDRLQTARIAALDADGRLRTVEQDLTTARSALCALLGLPPGEVPQLASPPLPEAPPPDDTLFALARSNRADLQALLAGYAAQEAAVHKAVVDQFPTLNLTVNTNRDSAGNTLLGPAIDFTLPLWNRNRGGIAVERATRAALKAEYETRLFQTRSEIAAARAGIALALRQRTDARQGLPALQAYAESARRAASRGDLSVETAQAAEQALRDRLTQIEEDEQAIRERTIALELLTGTPREAWK
ncbi:TolC family protein [Novosphingobium sp. KN65.2]|uniref:TolC family protein n=1 Tax=Novosphingobium sp. KN65.2 TaxID=1478134 RepID=UPI0005DC9814|nr:TolC family protein [Novosphingobium sp. KN65.2]CDO38329.1 putative Outer membrane efflux protein [Novosphingobium sp. KN65.2]